MHLCLLTEVNDTTQEVEESLKAFETLEEFDKFGSSKLFVIFASNLDANLQVLSEVSRQHCFQALQTVVYT